jgi:hypothetical protein
MRHRLRTRLCGGSSDGCVPARGGSTRSRTEAPYCRRGSFRCGQLRAQRYRLVDLSPGGDWWLNCRHAEAQHGHLHAAAFKVSARQLERGPASAKFIAAVFTLFEPCGYMEQEMAIDEVSLHAFISATEYGPAQPRLIKGVGPTHLS